MARQLLRTKPGICAVGKRKMAESKGETLVEESKKDRNRKTKPKQEKRCRDVRIRKECGREWAEVFGGEKGGIWVKENQTDRRKGWQKGHEGEKEGDGPDVGKWALMGGTVWGRTLEGGWVVRWAQGAMNVKSCKDTIEVHLTSMIFS